ncbi:hypothetical protein GCM10010991_33230 [Gemmobacter aquaticus]|uniref:Uncharacterized protein n=1 Tax=Gemmobacter aquaticus TaxID=490185 RepID=A0A917YM23_9RHOB|nr:hypothetical protein GCM10010991_33230 [Gemmobacter aquaticus]
MAATEALIALGQERPFVPVMVNPFLKGMTFSLDGMANSRAICSLASAAKQESQFWQPKSAHDNGRHAAPYRPAGDPGNADR